MALIPLLFGFGGIGTIAEAEVDSRLAGGRRTVCPPRSLLAGLREILRGSSVLYTRSLPYRAICRCFHEHGPLDHVALRLLLDGHSASGAGGSLQQDNGDERVFR